MTLTLNVLSAILIAVRILWMPRRIALEGGTNCILQIIEKCYGDVFVRLVYHNGNLRRAKQPVLTCIVLEVLPAVVRNL